MTLLLIFSSFILFILWTMLKVASIADEKMFEQMDKFKSDEK